MPKILRESYIIAPIFQILHNRTITCMLDPPFQQVKATKNSESSFYVVFQITQIEFWCEEYWIKSEIINCWEENDVRTLGYCCLIFMLIIIVPEEREREGGREIVCVCVFVCDSLSIQWNAPFLSVAISYDTIFEIFRWYEAHIMSTKWTEFIIRLIGNSVKWVLAIFRCSKGKGPDSAYKNAPCCKHLTEWNSKLIKQEVAIKNSKWIPPWGK